MKQDTDVSDEEIKGYMNFELLLASNIKRQKANRLKRIGGIIFSLIVLSSLSLWFVISTKEPTTKTIFPLQAPKADRKVLSPLPVEGELDAKAKGLQRSERSAAKEAPEERKKNEVIVEEKLQATKDLYIQAEPVDGYAALYEFFSVHLNYPDGALQDSIQGVETVAFLINADGKPEKITIRQSLGKLFDDEAIRVINTMPLWRPATLNGVPVASQMSIPLTFQLERIKPRKP